jgi:hypothetical protein
MKAGKEQNDHAKDVPQVDREGEESAATVPALTHPFIPFFFGKPSNTKPETHHKFLLNDL